MPDDPESPQINIAKIPGGRGIGALLIVIALIAVMLWALPALQLPALLGAAGGVLLAVVLILWHRRRPR